LKNDILAYMQKLNYKASLTLDISKALSCQSKESFQELSKALFELEKEGLIAKNKKGKYNLVERLGLLKGTIDLKVAGYGFIALDDTSHPDVFIPRNAVGDAFDKDYCLIRITRESSKDRFEGEIVRVIKRNLNIIIGEYFQGAIFPKNNPQELVFKVKKNKDVYLLDHSLVKAKVIKYSKNQILDCEVLEVLGKMSDPGIDIIEVINKHELSVDFPDDVKNEVKSIPSAIDKEPIKDHHDLTNEIIFTIDGDDTKDIDDAISLSKLKNNNYKLGVHIADVSYYVKKDSPLDKEAFDRGTSVYLADRVIPMLPRELSNGICSLNPQVKRFAISCEMEINSSGEVVFYEIFPSVIKSMHQMTYKNVNLMLEKNQEKLEEYKDIKDTVFIMQELAKILKDTRDKMGSINFETIEPKIIFDEQGKVKDIVIRNRGISENIIEEFMLVANQVIATHMTNLKLPFIYRIHEQPDAEKLMMLFSLAKELGYITSIPKKITHIDLQKLLAKVEDTKYEKVINTMMLRSMAKAKYSENNEGHYGLAFDNYTHFTSPIRRYPDLIVHRYIRDYIFLKKLDKESLSIKEQELPGIGLQTSKTERNAMLSEREVMDMKKAEYMENYIGVEFEGVVSSLTRFGMFVELPNTVEGLIHISTFPEAIDFIEDKMIYLGISSRIEYTIGMIIKVKCTKVDKLLGRVDFALV